jgi:hypothetical protein
MRFWYIKIKIRWKSLNKLIVWKVTYCWTLEKIKLRSKKKKSSKNLIRKSKMTRRNVWLNWRILIEITIGLICEISSRWNDFFRREINLGWKMHYYILVKNYRNRIITQY